MHVPPFRQKLNGLPGPQSDSRVQIEVPSLLGDAAADAVADDGVADDAVDCDAMVVVDDDPSEDNSVCV